MDFLRLQQIITFGITGILLASQSVNCSDAQHALSVGNNHRLETDEEKLLSHLFTHYNKFARPRRDATSTVTVTLAFSLMHIKDLDWEDERLTWLPNEHNGMQEIIVEAKSLWKPELAVINGAEKLYEDYNQFRAVITHDGKVHWEPAGVFKTMCEIDITYYPFDEQTCALTFGSWSYSTGKVNLTSRADEVNMDSYSRNGEWEVLETGAKRKEFSYSNSGSSAAASAVGLNNSGGGGRYSSAVAFNVQLRRRHLFYVMNVIMPSVMTSVLLLSVFFSTPAQKVQIGVVVLLSFRIFLLNVAGNIPKTSDHVPLLVIYLTCTLVITTLSMVLTVLVLNLYGTADHPVPTWMRDVVLIYIARAIGMCETARLYREAKDAAAADRRMRKARNGAGLNFFVRASLLAGAESDKRRQNVPSTAVDDACSGSSATVLELQPCGKYAAVENIEPTARQSASIGTPSSAVTTRKEPVDCRPPVAVDYSKDWKRVAEIVDRLFFWLFLLAILLSTLVLFHPLVSLVIRRKSTASSDTKAD